MGALSTRGAPSCSSRKLWRSLTSDTLGHVVCAVHDVKSPSAIIATPNVSRRKRPFTVSKCLKQPDRDAEPLRGFLAVLEDADVDRRTLGQDSVHLAIMNDCRIS